ncbi:MAG: single-stranded DNA-binding protein [Casimicrobiaceae bacterium]|nr:single-stranded DNA-binding protein [Casimicrobiaceae bacterium]MCX8097874.1 single-stranded DNA-binding protein [Casimicrobiaceae bacterium]MDW8311335.1 single-stranded DNA-binding protein [Burkholderiales bacterium]
MASVNRVMLIGNLGRDPEMRYLPSGEAVATFSLATTEQWKDKNGNKQERTDWHRVEFIGRTAEICGEYLKKGMQVYIEGRIQYDKWTDKDGVERTMTKIRGERMQMLGSRPGSATSADAEEGVDRGGSTPLGTSQPMGQAGGATSNKKKLDEFDDDIPF